MCKVVAMQLGTKVLELDTTQLEQQRNAAVSSTHTRSLLIFKMLTFKASNCP